MFGIGMPELLVILVVALIIIGPKKLPDLAKSLGKGLAEFRRAGEEVKQALDVEQIKDGANEIKDSVLYGKSDRNKDKSSDTDKTDTDKT